MSGDKVKDVQCALDNVKDKMRENVDQVLINSEKLETVEVKARDVENGAKEFHDMTVEVRRQFCWKKHKLNILMGSIVVALLIILIVAVIYSSR